MIQRALYLAPFPPARSGIADYAREFRAAVEAHTPWRLDLAEPPARVSGNTLRDLLVTRRRAQAWLGEGRLQEAALVHAEIGLKQYDEFWTLFWLQRLQPRLRCCVTVHDPPLVLAPALYPLACGSRRTLVRHAVRLLDYTPLGRSVIRSVLRRAAAVFVLTERGTESLRGPMGNQRLRTLPFLAYGGSGSRPERTGGRPLRVLYLGFWAPGKGLETLLEAARRVLSQDSGALEVVLAGGVDESGTNRAYVESVLHDLRASPHAASFEVAGYLPGERLDQAFADTDALVLPAIRTTSLPASSVLFRAFAAGLPVVASDIGTIGEEVRDGETGLLFRPGDPASLSGALLRLAGDPALRTRLGLQARAHVRDEHSASRVAAIAAFTYDSVATR